MSNRGFFSVGIWKPKNEVNVGGLWRSAFLYGASMIFTIGARYTHQPSDTPKTPKHIPLIHFDNLDDLIQHLPYGAPLVGVEMHERSEPLVTFQHPTSATYLLGAEDHGLNEATLERCHRLVQIETPLKWSLNVASAGAIVMWDRYMKGI